jgi:hypothetical protein
MYVSYLHLCPWNNWPTYRIDEDPLVPGLLEGILVETQDLLAVTPMRK